MPEGRPEGWLARLVAVLMLPVLVAACAPGSGEWAPDVAVQRALYSNGEPPEITLLTVINNRSGAGDHSALLINGEHRILYDPAGSWYNRHAPRRNDVHFGINARLEEIYLDYHARDTHHVIAQSLRLTPQQAAVALEVAQSQSLAAPGQCAVRTGGILREIPGLEDLRSTLFPRTLKDRFGEFPGVVTRRIDATDIDIASPVIAAAN
jgi:hypothetical protein